MHTSRLRLLIVEDEDAWITKIKTILSSHFYDKVIVLEPKRFISQAIESIKIDHPDILLLDLKLGNRWSWEILTEFSVPDFLTVFITSHVEYYEMAVLESSNFGFINKANLSKVTLGEYIDRALLFNKKMQIQKHNLLQRILNKDDIFGIESIDGNFYLVNRGEVIYAEVNQKVVTYHTFNGSIKIIGSLEKALAVLNLNPQEEIAENENTLFLRIHRDAIVNRNHVRAINKNTIVVNSPNFSPISLPISRNNRKRIRSILNK